MFGSGALVFPMSMFDLVGGISLCGMAGLFYFACFVGSVFDVQCGVS